MATNPRIDDLRKRLDREPQSRLFAQLAEELRKEGDLREAIQVARRGLEKHPNYPSARMTLGRALFDSRDFAGARSEFDAVVKGAPDNILASRLLAECLEALGDVPAAVERYKATLVFSPGDKQVLGRLEALEKQAAAGTAVAAASAPALAAASVPIEPALAPPAPARSASDFAPIPLVAADEEFELEQPFHDPRASAPVAAPVLAPPAPEVELDAELEPGSAPAEKAVAAEIPADIVLELDPPPAAAPAEPPPTAPPPPPGPPPPADDLTSATLAELYFNQGALDRAMDAYRRLVDREPANDRYRARLAEIQAIDLHLRAEETPATVRPPGAPETARQRGERTIAQLEDLLAAIKRGVKA